MQLPEAKPVHLIHVNPELNMARFYGIDIQPTLFGEMSVLRSWGRIGTKGRGMMVTYEDAAEASEALLKLDKQKRRRGYVAVTEKSRMARSISVLNNLARAVPSKF